MRLPCDTRAMSSHNIDPSDEARHEPTEERFWSESYYFDFHDDEGSLGGYVRIGLYPNLGVTWQWACLVGAQRPLVTAINHEAPLPPAGSLEIRCEGLAANHECRTPNERFGVVVDARAAVLEDPAQAYSRWTGRRPLSPSISNGRPTGPGATASAT